MTRIIGPTGSRRRRRFLLGPILLATLVGLLFAAGAQGVHDTGLFELDRNAVASATTAGDDWSTLYAGGGSADNFTGVLEDISTPGEQFTSGGSKDNNDISQWLWKPGEPLDKDDITNAYTAAYTNTMDTGGNNVGDLIVYYGLDRFANNGTAQVGFWFFQKKISLSDTASGGGFKFSGVHTVGDVLVQSNFTSGGRVSSVSVFEWVGSGGSNGALDLKFAGTDCVDADPNTPGDQPLAGDDPACATANIANETAPWPYTPKTGTAGTFPLSSFFEGGVNITRLIPGGSKCFPTFMAETRSSAPFDSRLKDFQLGNFERCGLELTTVPSKNTTDNKYVLGTDTTVTDTATVKVTPDPTGQTDPTGPVTFYICGPNVTGCSSTTGTQVGTTSVQLVGGTANDGTATATSANAASFITSVGDYCFAAKYDASSDPNYSSTGVQEFDGTTECFTVTGNATLATAQKWLPNDTAHITGPTGSTLSGNVTFTLYNTADCTGTAQYGPVTKNVVTDADASPVPTANDRYVSTTNSTFFVTTANDAVAWSWNVHYDDANLGDPTDKCETTTPAFTLSD